MGLVLRDWPTGWSLESTHFHGPNVVSCKVVTGTYHNPIIVSYLPLCTLAHLPDLEEALAWFRVQEPIVLVYLNVDLDEPKTAHPYFFQTSDRIWPHQLDASLLATSLLF